MYLFLISLFLEFVCLSTLALFQLVSAWSNFLFYFNDLINHIYWLRIFLLRTWAIDWRPLVGSLMEERWGRALNTAAGSDCLLVLSVRCVKFDCYILIYCLLTNSHNWNSLAIKIILYNTCILLSCCIFHNSNQSLEKQ